MICDKIVEEDKVPCDVCDCKNYIEYESDLNCILICARKNGPLTLEEASKRLGVSYVRIKQIEDKAIKKLREYMKEQGETAF